MRVLCLLLDRAGEIVTREELRHALWIDGTTVEFDGSLNAALKRLRSALGDDADNPTFIETVPRRGYRFIAPVHREDDGAPSEPNGQASPPSDTVASDPKTPSAEITPPSTVRWIAAAVLLLCIASVVIVGWRYTQHSPTESTPEHKVIAVLPFTNQGAGRDLDYLSYAIGNELVTDLTYSPSLSVRPFSSTSKYGSQPGDLAALGKELRVSHILAGVYLLNKQQLQVNLELVDVAKDKLVWRDEILVSPQEMVALRNQLTERASRGLMAAIHVPPSSLIDFPAPRNEQAFRLYLDSLGISHDPVPNREAIKYLERSVALDSGYPPTWAELGWRYYIDYSYGGGGDEERAKGLETYRRMKELDPHGTVNVITLRTEQGELEAAYDEAASLVQRRPDASASHYEMSYVLRYAGLLDEAGKECDAALSIDPGYSAFRSCAVPFIAQGDYGHAEKFIQLDSKTGFAAMLRLEIAMRTRDTAKGLAEAEFASQTGFPSAKLVAAFLHHASEAELNKAAAELERSSNSVHDPEIIYRNAEVLSYSGETDAALRQLAKAVAGNYCSYPAIDTNPIFDPLRQRPEFARIREAASQCQQTFQNHRRLN